MTQEVVRISYSEQSEELPLKDIAGDLSKGEELPWKKKIKCSGHEFFCIVLRVQPQENIQ